MPLMVVVGTINKYPPPADGWEVVHVDASARGIWDPERSTSVPIDVQADMRNLPFADATVDRIQSWHALEHVDQQGGRDTIREFARVLKPDGLIDLRVPDLGVLPGTANIETRLNLIYGDQTRMVDHELNSHLWGYTLNTLRALLAEHHFRCERVPAEYDDELHVIARRG